MAQWKRFRDLSIVKYAETYKRLNVKFDVYSGESQYSLDQMMNTLNELDSKGLLTELDGARVVDLKEYKLGTAVIEKKDGSLLYLSRDVAAAQDRFDEYNFDKMIYCVGTQQDHHFRQLFKVLELMGKTWLPRCEHVAFGLIKSDDGNMSTRKGTVVFLSQILDSVQEEMHTVMQKNEHKYSQIEDPSRVADIVGMSAVVVQDMGARRVKDYSFDWNRMFSFEGDTGPYLQYAHARMCSIERQGAERFVITPERVAQLDLSVLVEPEAIKVIDLIGSFPATILEVADTLEPCQLVNYALRLSHAVSSAYKELWVHGREDNIAEPRMAMYVAAKICLGNALQLLGLEPLQRM